MPPLTRPDRDAVPRLGSYEDERESYPEIDTEVVRHARAVSKQYRGDLAVSLALGRDRSRRDARDGSGPGV